MTSSRPPHSLTSSMCGLSAFMLPRSEGAPNRSQSMTAGSSDSHQTSSSSRKESVSHQGGGAHQRHSHSTAVSPYTVIHTNGSGSFHCNAANDRKRRLTMAAIQRIRFLCFEYRAVTAAAPPDPGQFPPFCKGAVFFDNHAYMSIACINLCVWPKKMYFSRTKERLQCHYLD